MGRNFGKLRDFLNFIGFHSFVPIAVLIEIYCSLVQLSRENFILVLERNEKANRWKIA
jgi:hypothetical protein